STACGSCRNFRRSVAAQLGYCALDRQRQPLRGDEIRACWESLDPPGTTSPPPLTPATAWPLEPGKDRTTVRLLEFVEVRAEVGRDGRPVSGTAGASPEPDGSPDGTLLAPTTEARWSLWGDAEA
ncbi:MAG: hypothetical protein QOJ75_1577, partial [Chloroflexota bacterium]|nr:hypothetical protein [Chloroflexota bacterium]